MRPSEILWPMRGRVRQQPRPAVMCQVQGGSCGNKKARDARVLHRFAHLCGRVAVMRMDRNLAIGPTTCRKRCATELYVRRFLKGFAREAFLLLRAGLSINQRPRISLRRSVSLASMVRP